MNKRDREQVRKAIDHLMDQDPDGSDFAQGIDILCHLIGECYPPAHVGESGDTISLKDILSLPDSYFDENGRLK